MKLCLIGHDFKYELEKLIRIFLPFEKIEFYSDEQISDSSAITVLNSEKGNEWAVASLYFAGGCYEESMAIETEKSDLKKERELKLALCLYECFCKATNYIPQWGILTGVRPAKLFSHLSRAEGIKNTEDYFKNYLKVFEKKIELCKESILGEDKIISLSKSDSFSLYISVPFCPTRCSYCSFVSHSVEQSKKLIPLYVENLCREIEITAKLADSLNLRLETVYIGGGTPTTLSAEEIRRVMSEVSTHFDMSNVREYTVEAGRPDTITKEKLLAIREGGATRISINPQTMNDNVLEAIGRRHTSKQTEEAFSLARELGFQNINMDLIAGLPTDTFDSFCNTVKKVIDLDPESVTVHSLSMKRASTLSTSGELPEIEMGKQASDMVDFAHESLSEKGIVPYYMYRQSKTVGNLENVGYSKTGFECLYNVYIMDETHTILACGASAVTKLKQPCGDYIERIFNFKYPYEYINRFDELISRKDKIVEFYNDYVNVEMGGSLISTANSLNSQTITIGN